MRGGGAHLDGVPLNLGDDDGPRSSGLISVPAGYGRSVKADKELRKRQGEPRVLGSIALEMALAAGGVFQFAIFGAPRIWDVAAGVLLVREAGGSVLARNRETGEWEELESFATAGADPAEQEKALRKWARPILAGNRAAVTFLAQHLMIRARSRARGRSGSSPDGGKPDSG